MRYLPPEHTSSIQADRIVSIERVSGEKYTCYDLQVEDNENFISNSLIVHNCLICDDLIKNASEAYNERVLDDIWNWYTGTFMSRAEHQGKGSIEIVNFTRWSTKDLCGRILDSSMSDDWINLVLPVEHNGELYCEDILPRESFERLRESMDSNIFEANYYQKPLDVEGRLFDTLKTYDTLPEGTEGVIAYCDTADEGSDYLACIVGAIKDGEGYITDIYFTQDNMQITEPATADLLVRNKVTNAKIESNNGGKGFARNVERIVWEKYHTKQVNITWFHQTENKMARILTGATFIQNHVYFPEKWDKKWPEFYKAVMGFSKEGKNKHDDGVEALVEWGKMITGDGSINSYVEWMKKMQEGKA
jgi:predicted phage terminase large subunit-like protein